MAGKKGQAALEFLMTYGWALIMILILIAAISYFGILNPKKIIPDKCVFGPEIECISYGLTYADKTLKLRLKNNVGEMITVSSFELTSEDSTGLSCTNPANPANWRFTDLKDLTFTDCDMDAAGAIKGETAKLFLTVNFYPVKGGSGYLRNVQGEIITKVS